MIDTAKMQRRITTYSSVNCRPRWLSQRGSVGTYTQVMPGTLHYSRTTYLLATCVASLALRCFLAVEMSPSSLECVISRLWPILHAVGTTPQTQTCMNPFLDRCSALAIKYKESSPRTPSGRQKPFVSANSFGRFFLDVGQREIASVYRFVRFNSVL